MESICGREENASEAACTRKPRAVCLFTFRCTSEVTIWRTANEKRPCGAARRDATRRAYAHNFERLQFKLHAQEANSLNRVFSFAASSCNYNVVNRVAE
ncbi:hypothetical protein PUN28_003077 [Cardiocondyla obscurior]|uniref:Transposase n=1 Tax=Cardiocondyla obscurior TaxID=286306 RepID=A0AAW2GIY7_9HYME